MTLLSRTLEMVLYMSNKPPQKYALNSTVKVPPEVSEKGQATIVGVEWGPDNVRTHKKTKGWLYWLKFETGGSWYEAAEDELRRWGN